MQLKKHRLFRVAWWGTNLLLVAAILCTFFAGLREYSVRKYLQGFSDAVVPESAPAQEKVEAILLWMRNGPPRSVAADAAELSKRNPETTLNYQQLLSVCGTATNAFLNLARSAGLNSRRLLLLTPEGTAKHVVAEVQIDGRWVVVDPAYRTIFQDSQGHLLTRKDLQNHAIFAQVISALSNYPPEYNFERYAHVRLARLPLDGFGLRHLLNRVYPGWDESVDWSLLLERESFLFLVACGFLSFFLLFLRLLLAWYADHRLHMSRFRLHEQVLRAGAALFSIPEIKE